MSRIETEIAVIGGGIVGCSTALHVALRGVPVVLLEKRQAGAAASGVNFGGVRRNGRAWCTGWTATLRVSWSLRSPRMRSGTWGCSSRSAA